MLAASVTLPVASHHEHRAFPHPSEAVRRCTGGVVTMARLSSFLARRPRDSSPRAWRISSEHIGIPYTGLDALMRHFNEHPEDRPLLATPQGVDLVNEILAAA